MKLNSVKLPDQIVEKAIEFDSFPLPAQIFKMKIPSNIYLTFTTPQTTVSATGNLSETKIQTKEFRFAPMGEVKTHSVGFPTPIAEKITEFKTAKVSIRGVTVKDIPLSNAEIMPASVQIPKVEVPEDINFNTAVMRSNAVKVTGNLPDTKIQTKEFKFVPSGEVKTYSVGLPVPIAEKVAEFKTAEVKVRGVTVEDIHLSNAEIMPASVQIPKVEVPEDINPNIAITRPNNVKITGKLLNTDIQTKEFKFSPSEERKTYSVGLPAPITEKITEFKTAEVSICGVTVKNIPLSNTEIMSVSVQIPKVKIPDSINFNLTVPNPNPVKVIDSLPDTKLQTKDFKFAPPKKMEIYSIELPAPIKEKETKFKSVPVSVSAKRVKEKFLQDAFIAVEPKDVTTDFAEAILTDLRQATHILFADIEKTRAHLI